MGSLIITIGNAAAAVANTAAAAARPSTAWPWDWFQRSTFPEWLQLLVGGTIVYTVFRATHVFELRFPERKAQHGKFVESLTKGVSKQTARLDGEFATALLAPAITPVGALAHLRSLRLLIHPPLAFIRRMRAYPLAQWPSDELAGAFDDWAAVVEAIDSLLGHMFDEAKSAIALDRLRPLIDQYERDEWYVRRELDKLKNLVPLITKAAAPFKKKEPEPKPI